MTVTRESSKNAVTHFHVLERFQDFTLVECRLETGRTHQIDLMRSSGLKPALYEREILKTLKHVEMRDGVFAAFSCYGHALTVFFPA